MRLGLNMGYTGAELRLDVQLVQDADRLGYHSVWTAEAYGSDAVTPLAWLGAVTFRIHLGTAIMQVAARSPAMTAMTAMTLDALSGRRFLLGLGVSGPQVVEGWHGQPFGKPLGKMREYIGVVRTILAREKPLEHSGDHYQVPYAGPGATGLGKPLKSILHGRADLPIYVAAIGPRNVALAAEIADGWLPLFVDPEQIDSLFGASLAGRKPGFEITATVTTVVAPLDEALGWAKIPMAFYIGGMGAKDKNFHLDLIGRLGYAEEAARVQELFLDGRRDEAIKAVPDELVDAISLLGPIGRIKERLELWRNSPVGTLLIAGVKDEPTLRAIRELVDA
ncbi:MAG TPA: LLM class F420-dependent oxidoreductase [Methylomirabilota bacterium]|nr:LLM class F420-dependent oxidoreductase [Methylomirabilota bacterium]